MARETFVNLPVRDLERSKAFFTKLGFEFNPQFTDETATCMVVSENSFVMLLVEERFLDFTEKKICDTSTSTEALFGFSARSREEVDEITNKAIEAGGRKTGQPMDLGFMYSCSFYDLDGHQWEVLWMDPAHVMTN